MPGFEVIGKEESEEVMSIFTEGGGVLFRHGFDTLRNNSFKVKEFEQDFGKFIGNDKALAVSSGTAALKVALSSLGLKAGDEVITQSFTFVATAEAIIESLCVPVFTEIDDTLNMDPKDLENRITSKTKAVIVVHMLGTPARLQEIKKICLENNLFLIEDTAWGCGGQFEGKKLGTYGDIGCFSFDYAKTITTGEGGMVVFKDESHFKKGSAYHDHGHENNPKVPRWEDTRSSSGFNFRMSELQAAVGIAQLRKLPYILSKQRENANKIREVVSKFKTLKEREVPANSIGTDDAFIFFSHHIDPLIIRNTLLGFGISTKILPEATTWHFARHWNHLITKDSISKLPINEAFSQSAKLLNSSVAIPNYINLPKLFLENIEYALDMALH